MRVLYMYGFRRLKIVLLCCVLIPLFGFPTGAFGEEASPFAYTIPKERQRAPGFMLPSIGGELAALADYKGKVLLLNFWSSVCAPCRKEMPALEALWKRLGDEGLVIVGINVDRRGERSAKRFMERYGLSFPLLLDREGEVRREYEVMVLPVTYIVGRDGRFIGKITGVREWGGKESIRFFKELVSGEEGLYEGEGGSR